MHKLIGFCPSCNYMKELDVSLGMISLNNPIGEDEVLIYQYHCASCNSFVRSTTMDHQEVSPNELVVFSIPEYV
jgi:C4-type Zn-finger protein